jgi:alpha-mannosidase
MTIYGHRHSDHTSHTYAPPVDNSPRVPKNITQSRVNNFLADGGQFYGMGIQRILWENRHSGSPHVTLQVYSVPDLKVKPVVVLTFIVY